MNSCVMPTGGAAGCTLIQDGLEDVYDIAISADGDSLHAVSRNGGAIFSFAAPGLGPLGCVLDDGDTVPAGCSQAQGLAAARGVAVSPDGKSVYVVSGADKAIVRFDRSETGVLTPAGCIGDAGTSSCSSTQQGLSPRSERDGQLRQRVGLRRQPGRRRDRALRPGPRDGRAHGPGVHRAEPGRSRMRRFPWLQDPLGLAGSPDARSVYVAGLCEQGDQPLRPRAAGRPATPRRAATTPTPADRRPPPVQRPPAPAGPSFPRNDFTIPRSATCVGECITARLRLTLPPGVPGRGAVCSPQLVGVTCVPALRTLAAASWPSAFASAKKRKLIATKVFRVKGGPLTVKVKLTKRARRVLKRKGRLKVRLQVDFKPTGGRTNSKRTTVTIKRKR